MKTINDYAELVKEEHALNKTLAPVEDDLTGASQPYAKGAKFIYNGIMYQAKTAIAQGDALVLNTNYEAADNVTKQLNDAEQNIYEVMGQNGAKNLIPNTASSDTNEGVIFTVNSDGTVSTSGASTKSTGNRKSSLNVCNIAVNSNLLGKTLKLSGAPADGLDTKWFILVILYDSSDVQLTTVTESGDGTEFTMPSNAAKMSVFLRTHYGVDVTGLVFKPMITLAEDTTSDYAHYVPYAKTNKELTDEVNSQNTAIANEVETRAKNGGGHNRLKYSLSDLKAQNTSGTWNNNVYTVTDGTKTLTFTVNSDLSITVNGTAPAYTSFQIHAITKSDGTILDSSLFGLELKMTGCPANGSLTSYFLSFYRYNGTTNADEFGEGITLTPSSDGQVNSTVSIRVNANTVCNNLLFKPMLCLATDAYSEYTPYVPTNAELLSADTNAVLGAHNLWAFGDVTFTTYQNFDISNLNNGVYDFYADVVSADTSATTCMVYDATNNKALGYITRGTNQLLQIELSGTNTLRLYSSTSGAASSGKDASFSNVLLKLASDPSTEYTPYAMTNRELTKKATVASNTSTLFKYHKVNSIVTMQLVGQQTYADIKNLTIPDGFRPNSICTALGYCVSGTSRYLAVFNLNSNGSMVIGKVVNNAHTTPSDTDNFEFSTCYYVGN